MEVHCRIKEVLNEFKLIKLHKSKLKLIVVDDSIGIYEVKDSYGDIHTIKIISNVPMFRSTKIKKLLYKNPIYFSHSFNNEEIFRFRLNDYTNENELIKLN